MARARDELNTELRRANEELEAFSYSVSHDLRAPLRAVDGYTHLLEEGYATRLDDEGRRLLGVVREGAARMGQLIDDLLNLSRIASAQLTRNPVDLAFETEQRDGGEVFVVRDNGAGFDMAYAGKLFRPFSGSTARDNFPGRGWAPDRPPNRRAPRRPAFGRKARLGAAQPSSSPCRPLQTIRGQRSSQISGLARKQLE